MKSSEIVKCLSNAAECGACKYDEINSRPDMPLFSHKIELVSAVGTNAKPIGKNKKAEVGLDISFTLLDLILMIITAITVIYAICKTVRAVKAIIVKLNGRGRAVILEPDEAE